MTPKWISLPNDNDLLEGDIMRLLVERGWLREITWHYGRPVRWALVGFEKQEPVRWGYAGFEPDHEHEWTVGTVGEKTAELRCRGCGYWADVPNRLPIEVPQIEGTADTEKTSGS